MEIAGLECEALPETGRFSGLFKDKFAYESHAGRLLTIRSQVGVQLGVRQVGKLYEQRPLGSILVSAWGLQLCNPTSDITPELLAVGPHHKRLFCNALVMKLSAMTHACHMDMMSHPHAPSRFSWSLCPL